MTIARPDRHEAWQQYAMATPVDFRQPSSRASATSMRDCACPPRLADDKHRSSAPQDGAEVATWAKQIPIFFLLLETKDQIGFAS
jgi:hypothetical protein